MSRWWEDTEEDEVGDRERWDSVKWWLVALYVTILLGHLTVAGVIFK
jgi:hypothetical protein